MIVIPMKGWVGFNVQVTVCEDPTPGTWGSHQLLLREYRLADPWIESEKFKQLKFNYAFLKDMQLDYGPLWCVYCGREELKIYHWSERRGADVATTDHFKPRSLFPELAYIRSNLRVSCDKCNTRKGIKIWKEKFPYD